MNRYSPNFMCYDSNSTVVSQTHIDDITIKRDHETNKLSYEATFTLLDEEGKIIDRIYLFSSNGTIPVIPKAEKMSTRDLATEMHLLLDKMLVAKKFERVSDLDVSAIAGKIKRAKK